MRGMKSRIGIQLPPPIAGALWVPLTKGKFALVDKQDRWVQTVPWMAHDAGYATRKEGGRSLYMHRELLGLGKRKRGDPEVDHINGNGFDNRRKNLRLVSHQQNLQNQKPRGGSSRFRGVCWDALRGKWMTTIRLGNRRWYSRFDSELDAAVAYNERALALFGPHARLNQLSI